jgi:asparagine synthase (glutamine-hydrolysing)
LFSLGYGGVVDVIFVIGQRDAIRRRRKGACSSYALRKAFEGYLPDEVLWRQKEQFSDGVGYRWIDSLKATAEERISDIQMDKAKYRFPYNTPNSKEAYMYREIFESHFPGEAAARAVPGGPSIACSTPTAIAWDTSFAKNADPSGRAVLGVHQHAKG